MDPETSSGRREWRKPESRREIDPVRIFAFDDVDLPLAVPALELLLARDGGMHVAEQLEPDERVNLIPRSEALHFAGAVLVESSYRVGCYADVQRAIWLACEDVDARLFHGRSECGAMDAETSSA